MNFNNTPREYTSYVPENVERC